MASPSRLFRGMLTIGIRYCGGCNPQIDRSRIVREVKEALKKRGLEVDLTTLRERPVDMILLVSGCRHACLESKNIEADCGQPLISIKGEMVDAQYVEEVEIVEFLVQRIRSLFEEAVEKHK